jgi:phosphatidylglycerophosphatase A
LAALPFCLLTAYCGGLWGVMIGSVTLFILGLWTTSIYLKNTGKQDPSEVVIDEAAGMMVACLPLVHMFDLVTLVSCVILFRVFDAIKIGPVGWFDKNINGAWGVMLDDIVAGLLAAILVLGYLLWMN